MLKLYSVLQSQKDIKI